MFNHALLFRFGPAWTPDLSQLEEKLAEKVFAECGLTQERSTGWVPPRGDVNGAMVEAIGGQWILKLMQESKSVPASVIARAVDERKAAIMVATGRKPGKKETRDLKDEVRLSLLPLAFPSRSSVQIWIDPEERLLLVDVSSVARADAVLTFLNEAMPDTGLQMIQTNTSTASAMADWLLSQEPPAGFTIDRECELKAADDSKATVRYAKHALDIEEIQQHIRHGKMPTKLAMTWEGKVSFVLNDKMQVSKLTLLDSGLGGGDQSGAGDGRDDRFDADVAIATGTIKQMIPSLIEALSGELVIGGTQGASLNAEAGDVAARAKVSAAQDAFSAQPEEPQPAGNGDALDPLYEQAVTVVKTSENASISLVQRHLKIGYNRAARLLETMETNRKVSSMDGAGMRKVLMAA